MMPFRLVAWQIRKTERKRPAAKKPKVIDMEFIEAKRENLKGKTALGIYEGRRDAEMVWNKPGGARPKEFSSEAADVHLLVTLEARETQVAGAGHSDFLIASTG